MLAIDQIADERTDKPAIAKAVTLEVDATAAQKLALAATVGTLSLMLRRAGEATATDTRRVTLGDLSGRRRVAQPRSRGSRPSVVRGGADKREDYSVPIEGMTVGRGAAGAR